MLQRFAQILFASIFNINYSQITRFCINIFVTVMREWGRHSSNPHFELPYTFFYYSHP